MWEKESLPCQFAEAYWLVKQLGEGGMAEVFEAEVDLQRFNFARLISYREKRRGKNRQEDRRRRMRRERRWAQKDREELLKVVQEYHLPYPASQQAAVKILMRSAAHLEKRFIGEWEQLIAIRHPNIIQVYDGGIWQGRWYYAMELIPHFLSLEERQALPLRTKLEIIFQVARGLMELHRRNIIHRDIKPSNIITYRHRHGRLVSKITDLGIAKDLTDPSAATLTQDIIGTPHFMAPEQFKKARSVDYQADIYSLGATFYAMLCGHTPYEGKSVYQVIGSLAARKSPTPLQKFCPDIPPEIKNLVEQMMAFVPEQRPSLQEICQRLEHFCQSKLVRKTETFKNLPARRRDTKRRPRLAKRIKKSYIIKAVFLLLGLLLVLRLWVPRRVPRPKPYQPLRLRVAALERDMRQKKSIKWQTLAKLRSDIQASLFNINSAHSPANDILKSLKAKVRQIEKSLLGRQINQCKQNFEQVYARPRVPDISLAEKLWRQLAGRGDDIKRLELEKSWHTTCQARQALISHLQDTIEQAMREKHSDLVQLTLAQLKQLPCSRIAEYEKWLQRPQKGLPAVWSQLEKFDLQAAQQLYRQLEPTETKGAQYRLVSAVLTQLAEVIEVFIHTGQTWQQQGRGVLIKGRCWKIVAVDALQLSWQLQCPYKSQPYTLKLSTRSSMPLISRILLAQLPLDQASSYLKMAVYYYLMHAYRYANAELFKAKLLAGELHDYRLLGKCSKGMAMSMEQRRAWQQFARGVQLEKQNKLEQALAAYRRAHAHLPLMYQHYLTEKIASLQKVRQQQQAKQYQHYLAAARKLAAAACWQAARKKLRQAAQYGQTPEVRALTKYINKITAPLYKKYSAHYQLKPDSQSVSQQGQWISEAQDVVRGQTLAGQLPKLTILRQFQWRTYSLGWQWPRESCTGLIKFSYEQVGLLIDLDKHKVQIKGLDLEGRPKTDTCKFKAPATGSWVQFEMAYLGQGQTAFFLNQTLFYVSHHLLPHLNQPALAIDSKQGLRLRHIVLKRLRPEVLLLDSRQPTSLAFIVNPHQRIVVRDFVLQINNQRQSQLADLTFWKGPCKRRGHHFVLTPGRLISPPFFKPNVNYDISLCCKIQSSSGRVPHSPLALFYDSSASAYADHRTRRAYNLGLMTFHEHLTMDLSRCYLLNKGYRLQPGQQHLLQIRLKNGRGRVLLDQHLSYSFEYYYYRPDASYRQPTDG